MNTLQNSTQALSKPVITPSGSRRLPYLVWNCGVMWAFGAGGGGGVKTTDGAAVCVSTRM